MKSRVTKAFRERFGELPRWVVRSPGRVNLIGEHTDYNDGFVLPIAIERAIWLAFRPRCDGRVVVYSLEQATSCEYSLEALRQTDSGWAEYLKGMTAMLQAADHDLAGWEGVLTSDLPIGGGLSSSAALEMATGLAFATVSKFPFDGMEMARLGQRAENEWIGARTGIMDQMISANAKPGSALLIDCRDLSTRSIEVPGDVTLLVMDTRTRHDHRTSGYGERRASCEAVAQAFGVSHLRDLSAEELMARGEGLDLDAESLKCARHVVTENRRVLEAVEAMGSADVVAWGRLMDASHESLRDDFRVSNQALDTMVAIVRTQTGCLGARMTGGGFGGCAVALVESSRVREIEEVVSAEYEAITGLRPEIFPTTASGGTAIV